MRLLIVSHTPHFCTSGQVSGWGPTVREVDYLAKLFETVTHIAPLHAAPAPASALPYAAKNVVLCPVRPAGGESLSKKWGVVRQAKGYWSTISAALPVSDVVHVRCPANISLFALLRLTASRTPRFRWVKYAGNWRPEGADPWSYAVQRAWLLRGLHRGVVTVNGHWLDQPRHVVTFPNPCLTEEERRSAAELAASKRSGLCSGQPVRLLFVGRLEAAKGVGRAIAIVAALRSRGLECRLDVVGDGPARTDCESQVRALGLDTSIKFHGWIPRPALSSFYASAHFLLLPSASEGWPKVLSEGMAYGAIAVAGAVSGIAQTLRATQAGIALAPDDTQGFSEAIERMSCQPKIWAAMSQAAVDAARLFTYERYLDLVRAMFASRWGLELG